MTITLDDLVTEVARAARSAATSWTGAVDVEDVEQDMWVKLYATPKTLTSLFDFERDQRGKVLRAIARQCAGAEMASREHFSGNAAYSTDDVRRILDAGGARPEWGGDEPGSVSHTEWLDTQAGLEALGAQYSREGKGGPWYAEVLFAHYVADDYEPEDNGQTLSRARDALTAAMNAAHKSAKAAHDGPGSRRAVSNSAAQSLTRFEGGAQ
jgi:hypothetical protein